MAKHDVDPVLRQLVRAINESGTGAVPVTVSVHGTALTGALIPQRRYFAELTKANPLLSALEPASGLLGKDYATEMEAESGRHLHMTTDRPVGGGEGSATADLWRVSLEAVDGWTLRHGADAENADDKGPFARLLGNA